MPEIFRLDSADFEPLPWEKMPDGRYWGHVVLGKVNKKLPYRDKSGNTWFEHVSEKGLFNKAYVDSLAGNPIVMHHPRSGRYNLNKEGLKVGHLTTRFAREDDELIFEAFIDDYRAIEKIDSILKNGDSPEISPGYSLSKLIRVDEKNFEQLRERNDHVAAPLLPGEGRGGKPIRMRFDKADCDIAVSEKLYFLLDSQEEKKSMKVEINGRSFEVDNEEFGKEVILLQGRTDSLTKDNQKLTSALSKTEGELQGLKTKLDSIDADERNEERKSADIEARLDTWAIVLPVFRTDRADFKPDYKMSVSDIKKAFIKHRYPNLNLDDKTDAYIDGYWEGVKPSTESNKDSSISRADALLSQINQKAKQTDRADSVEEEKEIQAVCDKYQNAWKSNN